MKPWTVRIPEELLNWIRKKAAEETIKQNQQVSMNSVIVDIVAKAKAEEEKGVH